MLVLSRRAQQQIVFPGLNITLSILQVRGNIVKVGIEAPLEVKIKRKEVELPTELVETDHHRRNQLNTLQLQVDAIQMRLAKGETVDARRLVQKLISSLDLDSYEINSPDTTAETESDAAGSFRVLVVEDSDNERGLMTYLLASHGFVVYVARDGCEALEQLRRGCGLPDVILMDVDMPFGNGLEALKRFRQDTTLSDLLIYAVTGSRRDQANEPPGRSWDRWFSKPVDIHQLVDTIHKDCTARCAVLNDRSGKKIATKVGVKS